MASERAREERVAALRAEAPQEVHSALGIKTLCTYHQSRQVPQAKKNSLETEISKLSF